MNNWGFTFPSVFKQDKESHQYFHKPVSQSRFNKLSIILNYNLLLSFWFQNS